MKPNKLNYLVLFVLFATIVSCETETEKPRPTFTLSTVASPTEGGTITASSSSGTYTEGQTVTLTPDPIQIGCSGNGRAIPAEAQAHFSAPPRTPKYKTIIN